MFTTDEIRKSFRDATEGKHATKGRKVTFEMMEKDTITRTIEETHRVLRPARVVNTSSKHVLIRMVK
jgi:hypothetical protein